MAGVGVVFVLGTREVLVSQDEAEHVRGWSRDRTIADTRLDSEIRDAVERRVVLDEPMRLALLATLEAMKDQGRLSGGLALLRDAAQTALP